MASQALIYFPGIESTLSWSFSFSPGTDPSTCSITTAPLDNLRQSVGDLIIRQDGTTLKFIDARISRATISKGRGGRKWTLFIQDRRWKWKYGKIDGSYNIKSVKDGKEVTKREKRPQELATLLLKGMDEKGFNVSALPNNSRPTVDWQAANPADELGSLCNSLGCYVVLNPLSNKVEIHKIGEGRGLPSGGRRIDASYPLTFQAQPDEIRVVSGPVLFQDKFKLGEAVGIETDGKLKKVDDLSYKPENGWENDNPSYHTAVEGTYKKDGKTLQLQDLAKASVWKMYRITGLTSGGWSPEALKGSDLEPQGIDDLDFQGSKISQTEDSEGMQRDEPAAVIGEFGRRDISVAKTAKGTVYPGSFSIDSERGIVTFSDPVFIQEENPTGSAYSTSNKPAVLELETSYTASREGVLTRHEEFRKSNGRTYKTGPMLIRRPEIIRKVIGGDNAQDNKEDVKKEAEYYLDATAATFSLKPSADVSYSRIMGISLDGTIRQVTWSGRPGITRVSLSQEHSPYTPSYESQQRAAEDRRTLDDAKLASADLKIIKRRKSVNV